MISHRKPDPVLLRIHASAGSGKTYRLTRDYLALLRQADVSEQAGLSCAPAAVPRRHGWPEILAITFTNRAALEMKERIIRTLKSTALGLEHDPPEGWTDALAASWLEIILRRYGSLNVRTIDSLLHAIVRLSALELGLAPDFTPVFATEEALTPLLDALLEQSRHDGQLREDVTEACRTILLHTATSSGFMNSRRLRSQVLSLVKTAASAGPPPTTGEITARLEGLASAIRTAAAEMDRNIQAEALPVKKYIHTCLDFCLKYERSMLLKNNGTFNAQSLDEWLLTAGQGKASATAERAFARLRLALDTMNGEGSLLCTALSLLPYARLAWRVHEALADYLQGQSTLPADLVPVLAQQVLCSGYGVTEAFCRMGASLNHILIDEFQDTSLVQWSALHPLAVEALARGGSLTAVGDVKQSIYSWRGGDPRLFSEIITDSALLRITGKAETDILPTNRRSADAVVRANNSIFTQLADPCMAARVLRQMLSNNPPEGIVAEAVKDLQEAYKDAGQATCGKQGGYVLLERIEAESSPDSASRIADRVLSLVREVSSRRPLGDIGILVRSNSFGKMLAQRLLSEGFPVVTENSLLLAEHPLINQCIAFLQWLDAPHDELAFWTMIAGPRLLLPMPDQSRESLENWLCEAPRGSLLKAFRRDFAQVWQERLAPFSQRAGLISAYDAVREMLRLWNVWERQPDDAAFLQRFLEVLHLAEQQDCIAISAFLAYWGDNGQEEKAPMPDNVDAIRIMTIHASKGLQFPVVIVPGHAFLTTSGRGRPEPPECVELGGMRLVARRTTAMPEAYFSAQAERAREILNLLYVAWTRAESELYALINTYADVQKHPGLARALPLLLEHLPSPWIRHENGSLSLGTPPPPAPIRAAALDEAPKAIHLSTETHQKAAPMDWLPRLRVFRNEPDALFFSARRRGTFTHTCLEHMTDFLRGLENEPDRDLLQLRIDEAVTICRRTFPMSVPDDALPGVKENLLWFFAQPDALRLLREGTAEQPLMDADGSLHRPDLLCPEKHNNTLCGWTVLEYKTGQPVPEHTLQLERYLRLIEHVSGCPAKGILVYLDLRIMQPVLSPDQATPLDM